MQMENSLSKKDMGFILINLLTYRLFTDSPLVFPKTAGQAATISAILSAIAAMLVIIFLCRIRERLSGESPVTLISDFLGKKRKALLYIPVLAYLLVSSILMLKEFSETAKLIAFPTAPLCFTALFLTLGIVFSAYCGTKPIARLHSLFVPIILGVLFFIIISALWGSDFSNLFPILGRGPKKVLSGGFYGTVMFTDIIIFLLIVPPSKKGSAFHKHLWPYALTGLMAVVLTVFSYTVKIPYPISADSKLPAYLLLKEIHYGKFLQRIDALFLLASSLSGMLYLGLCIRVFSNIFKEAFSVSDKAPIVFPITLIVLFSALGAVFISSHLALTLLLALGFGSLFLIIVLTLFSAIRRKNAHENP